MHLNRSGLAHWIGNLELRIPHQVPTGYFIRAVEVRKQSYYFYRRLDEPAFWNLGTPVLLGVQTSRQAL